MSSCSVIMVSYHTGAVLFAGIRSVLSQSHLAELVVVDNGNPPATLARLQALAAQDSRLKLLTGGGNVGFGRANNAGAKLATGDFVLLLNPDCLLPPDALKDLMLAFDEVPGAMLAGGFLQNSDGSEQRGGRRQLLTPKTAVTEALFLYKFIPGLKRLNDNGTFMPKGTHAVPAISGAFMCMRRDDYVKLGGFDEGYFLHVEDMDLCMRVHKAGGQVICVPRVKVTHMLSTSGEVSSRFIEWHKAKGFMRYFHTHFPGVGNLPVVLLADLGAIVRFCIRSALIPIKRKLEPYVNQEKLAAARRFMVLACGHAQLPETRELYGKVVIVTGATSALGLCVVRRLIASGAAVLAISRNEEMPFHHAHLRWLKGDLADDNLHLGNYVADMVVHCAPLWHLPAAIHMFADAEISRVIGFGSTSVFSKANSHEDYEQSVAEQLAEAEDQIAAKCNSRGMRWTILRPTMIYGAGLDANVTKLARFIMRFGFCPIFPPALGRRQPVHADDLAQVVLRIVADGKTYSKSYNLGGGEVLTYRAMVERIFVVCGRKQRLVESRFLPFVLDLVGRLLHKKHFNGEMARRMNEDLVFFHDDAQRDFGYAPRPFLAGGVSDLEGY